MIYLLILGGLALLAIGGEAVVRGSVAAARRLGVSELLIGLTLVGFATSTPELLTSVNAALRGSEGVALGNVVGSNISNVLFIFALTALIKPAAVEPRAVRRDGVFMLAASAAAAGIAIHLGVFSAMTGWLMLAVLAVYLAVAFLDERRVGSAAAELHADCAEARAQAEMGLGLALGLSIGGVALLVWGADLLVRGAVDLARLAGLSETVIGLTIVALGTSLPELVASLAAALRGRSDVPFGNIVGSNN
jgi:cation:H+ antiporter